LRPPQAACIELNRSAVVSVFRPCRSGWLQLFLILVAFSSLLVRNLTAPASAYAQGSPGTIPCPYVEIHHDPATPTPHRRPPPPQLRPAHHRSLCEKC